MKKAVVIILIISAIIFSIFSPWKYLRNLLLQIIGLPGNKPASIAINSKVGTALVYIDDKEQGETPFEENIKAGNHTVKLVKKTNQPEFYTIFEKSIDIEEGTQVVINWELGPGEEFSSGEIYFFKERLDSTDESLAVSIIPFPDTAQIYFDGAKQEDTRPLIIDEIREGKHKVKIEKEGYISSELDFQTKSGYDLFLEVRLFPIPLNIENAKI